MAPLSPATPGPDLHGDTHVGMVRTQNQDHFLACVLDDPVRVMATSLEELPEGWLLQNAGHELPAGLPVLAAVADGVGGGRGGEEAARAALSCLPLEVAEALADPLHPEALVPRLAAAVLRVHARVAERGRDEPRLAGMATTLTAWLGLGEGRALVIQIGDSRAYRLRDGQLQRLTVDQTMAQDLVNRGLVPSVRQAPAGWDNVLTSALGGGDADPVVQVTDRAAGDVILVCSDGVMKHIDDHGIRAILALDGPAASLSRRLVSTAVEDGGVDNVTAVVLREGAQEPG